MTVDDELTRRGTLEGVGGSNYLVELSQSMPSTVNARAYVQIVDVYKRQPFSPCTA